MIVLTLLTTSKMNQTEVKCIDSKPAKSQFWQVMFIPYIGQRVRGH